MKMLPHSELLKMFNKGYFREVYNEVRKYGGIISDFKLTETTGYYQGDTRYLKINHLNTQWGFTLHNGEVIQMEYDEITP